MDVLPHFWTERANGAYQANFVGNDVEAHAAVDAANCDDGWRFRHVELTARDRLKSEHDLGADDDRIDTRPRYRAVRLLASDCDPELIRTGHGPAGPKADVS